MRNLLRNLATIFGGKLSPAEPAEPFPTHFLETYKYMKEMNKSGIGCFRRFRLFLHLAFPAECVGKGSARSALALAEGAFIVPIVPFSGPPPNLTLIANTAFPSRARNVRGVALNVQVGPFSGPKGQPHTRFPNSEIHPNRKEHLMTITLTRP